MKTNGLFVMFVMAFFTMSTIAQQVKVGAIGGLNIADMDLTSAEGKNQLTTSIITPAVGVIVELGITNYVQIDFEPMYLQKGGTQMATSSSPDATLKMSVFEIPALVKVGFGNTVHPYLKAGPTLGFILNSEAKMEYGGAVAGQELKTYKADYDDVLGNVDLGLTAGAGVSVKVKKASLFVEGRYSMGLTDLYKGGNVVWSTGDESIQLEKSGEAKLKTKAIQVMVGVMVPIGK